MGALAAHPAFRAPGSKSPPDDPGLISRGFGAISRGFGDRGPWPPVRPSAAAGPKSTRTQFKKQNQRFYLNYLAIRDPTFRISDSVGKFKI